MSNRVVVITGASAGIGAALAEICSQRGDRVVLVARREEKLAEVARRCAAETLVGAAAGTKRGGVERGRHPAIAKLGHVDVWVNNAGRRISRLVSERGDDDLDEMMLVNV